MGRSNSFYGTPAPRFSSPLSIRPKSFTDYSPPKINWVSGSEISRCDAIRTPPAHGGILKKLSSNYPLGQLLIAIFNQSGLNLPRFVEAIGYRNVNNGIRGFQRFLSTGFGPSLLLSRLAASRYAPHPDALTFVAQQHMEQFNQELYLQHGFGAEDFEEEFRPFLHAVPALPDVENISFFAQSGEFSRYTIRFQRKVALLPADEQYKMVKGKVRRHYRETRGTIHFLGAIHHYLYYHSWNEPPVAFSVEGEPLGIADNATVPRTRVDKLSRAIDERLMLSLLNAPDTRRLT